MPVARRATSRPAAPDWLRQNQQRETQAPPRSRRRICPELLPIPKARTPKQPRCPAIFSWNPFHPDRMTGYLACVSRMQMECRVGGDVNPQKTSPRRSLEHQGPGCQGQSKRVSRKLIDYSGINTDSNNFVSDGMMLASDCVFWRPRSLPGRALNGNYQPQDSRQFDNRPCPLQPRGVERSDN